MTPPTMTTPLPPVAPDVTAAAVENLSARLRKKLDAAIEQYAAAPATADGDTVSISCGEDAVVTLAPGPSGTVTDADQARCTCLLAPRCLHRAAVLGACPVADPDTTPAPTAPPDDGSSDQGVASDRGVASGHTPAPNAPAGSPSASPAGIGTLPAAPGSAGPTAAQVAAAAGLWSAAAAALAAGVPAAGAVPQADLLRAAHTARLAGLHRAEAAALRVVRGLRSARARHDSHRLADLVSALRELLLTTGLLAASEPDPALIGTARRGYQPGGSLRVHGVCREPVISATGYGGVVTHLLAEDGRWFSVADVKPGGPARARGAATATVALGAATLDHAQLARGGLLVTGATVSPDGRLGSGRGVRATPLAGLPWSSGPMAALFARPLAEAVATLLSATPGDGPERAEAVGQLVGCDMVVAGAAGDHLLAHELRPGQEQAPSVDGSPAAPTGPLIRLVPASGHPDLAHTANLQRLASRPGLRIRVLGRLDPDRATTLRPLAVGPVPYAEATLRLPAGWLDRADLGYDRLQGSHLPPREACPAMPALAHTLPDPMADAPLWRFRHLVELAVAGGRRSVGEFARTGGTVGGDGFAPLRRAGFQAAAELAAQLAAEADRRGRDAFGRLTDPDTDRYAWAWLGTAVHLAATERALVRASWHTVG
jgi:SWIM zinc finger